MKLFKYLLLALCLAVSANAEHVHGDGAPKNYPQRPADCSMMEIWDLGMGMCMPLAMSEMPMRMLMISGGTFGGFTEQEGPRGKSRLWSTSMIMIDAGTSVGDRHYLNLDLMLTAERWTLPSSGYPLLLQVGEHNELGVPYLDAQHPHSSPFMGITFSDTIRLAEGSALKVFFSPRGETTEGPIAFMHRPTGMINPDAPLGHHVGQDVGHISSTVLGASLKIGTTRIEASVFHGEEPHPTHVDLPLGTPDSLALRFVEDLSAQYTVMASAAYVNQPEPGDLSIDHVARYSASLYTRMTLTDFWSLDRTTIYGAITHYDHADLLHSLSEEFWLHGGNMNFWGRFELLQRTPNQLSIPGAPAPNDGKWILSTTLGYTHILGHYEGASLGLGASVTKQFLPAVFATSYGGSPWSGKIFLHLKGMKMWGM